MSEADDREQGQRAGSVVLGVARARAVRARAMRDVEQEFGAAFVGFSAGGAEFVLGPVVSDIDRTLEGYLARYNRRIQRRENDINAGIYPLDRAMERAAARKAQRLQSHEGADTPSGAPGDALLTSTPHRG